MFKRLFTAMFRKTDSRYADEARADVEVDGQTAEYQAAMEQFMLSISLHLGAKESARLTARVVSQFDGGAPFGGRDQVDSFFCEGLLEEA